ncbi:aminoglycoside phosphotransferase family protein [Nonomuraea sp. NPDC050328]|uniref:aminoglycoside phosphotransferase family protein n=1 Tax=Nonomuraea sp. NPDC050328 TaxID=3364361 RepID=UPI00379C1724
MSFRPHVDAALAARLVEAQFPQWSGLPLTLVEPGGSDHMIFRLGDGLAVRLPRHSDAIEQAAKELEWLPRLAPHLPLAVPEPVAVGEPGFGYPWPWAVSRWLEGEVATVEGLGDSAEAAGELAGFLRALQAVEPAPFPQATAAVEPAAQGTEDGDQHPDGGLLAVRDGATRATIAQVAGVFDAAAMTAVWDAALAAPGWTGPPVWFHGDFHTGNLLTTGGALSAVIDFGGLGVGDPACDLMVAYTLMTPRARAAFREALEVDEATWLRGRGWALATGLNAYVAYAAVDARVAAQTTRQITQALAPD